MAGQLIPLLEEVRACQACADDLPLGPRPVLRAAASSKILIIGQAPGTRVHASGIPWDDPSGDRLRLWLGLDKEQFYDEQQLAIVPMGFCYPGKGKSGDLPPRKECAELWHDKIMAELPAVELTLLIGQYAQNHYLDTGKETLTERVKRWQDFLPSHIPLPHPSPRNQIWLKKNAWFEQDVVPFIRTRVQALMGA